MDTKGLILIREVRLFPCVCMYSCISFLLSMLIICICIKWESKPTKFQVRPGKLEEDHVNPIQAVV